MWRAAAATSSGGTTPPPYQTRSRQPPTRLSKSTHNNETHRDPLAKPPKRIQIPLPTSRRRLLDLRPTHRLHRLQSPPRLIRSRPLPSSQETPRPHVQHGVAASLT